MAIVGIIANPASGKDIRRLTAHASVFSDNEKANVVRRVLAGLQAAGVDRALLMPDYSAIGQRALDRLHLEMEVSYLDMPLRGEQQDSTDAARLMADMGATCIVTLGGDGTNRVVAKACGEVPLVPISTGTNNVFPYMVEGTLAGLAAGMVARGVAPVEAATERTRRLEILREGQMIDLALVDVAVYDGLFVGARAIWDVARVRAVVLSRPAPNHIGMSSYGGNLYCPERNASHGVYLELGEGPVSVTASLAPGLIATTGITSYRRLDAGDEVEVKFKPSLLALDGEREVQVRKGMPVSIRLSDRGPRVVDVAKALGEAARRGAFVRSEQPTDGGCSLLSVGVCQGSCGRSVPANHTETAPERAQPV